MKPIEKLVVKNIEKVAEKAHEKIVLLPKNDLDYNEYLHPIACLILEIKDMAEILRKND